MPSKFWLGVILVYCGLLLCLVEICLEPWLLKKPLGIQVVLVGLVFFCICVFTIREVAAGTRCRQSLTQWLRGEIALGKSARELVDYAMRGDPETGTLLQEIALELGAL